MNLIDAIKSGKPFRRKGWDAYAMLHPSGTKFINPDSYSTHTWDAADWIADDWEIQEPAVTITRSELCRQVVRLHQEWNCSAYAFTDYAAELAKRLGMEAGA